MPFDVETLLSWDNQELFALQTAADQENRWKTIGPTASDADSVTVPNAAIEGQVYDFLYFQTVTRRILKSTNDPPLTIFELPAGLLMVPVDPRRDDKGTSSDVV